MEEYAVSQHGVALLKLEPSIGRVNPELYALAAGSWNLENSGRGNSQSRSNLEEWTQNYVNVLCMNSWQVKRYIDVYSASSVNGFSNEDLMHVLDKYARAEEHWLHTVKECSLHGNDNCSMSLPALKKQTDEYFNFLATVANLARSKWTEFNLKMMGIGFSIMMTSLVIHFLAIKRIDKLYAISTSSYGSFRISFRLIFACMVVVVRACSLLSNSYILEEGKVANFLLATTALLNVQYSVMKKKLWLEAVAFVMLTLILRLNMDFVRPKQAVGSVFMNMWPSWMLRVAKGDLVQMYIMEIMPVLALILLAYVLYRGISRIANLRFWKYVILGSIFSYILIVLYWASEIRLSGLYLIPEGIIRRNIIPQIIYAMGFTQLLVLVLLKVFTEEKNLDTGDYMVTKTVAMLAAWSSTVIILSGKQGPLVAFSSIAGGWCIMRLKSLDGDNKNDNVESMTYFYPVTQWCLFAVCLFFSTGHWCAFDGLRYPAAFIGFENFMLIPQAILLTIDTYGFSHILPIFGLPLLVVGCQYRRRKPLFFMRIYQVYLMYGLITAVTVVLTIVCVTIQRRHLMVWGLFAPKYVFDVVGLIISDIMICLASLYYYCYSRREEDHHNNNNGK